MTWRTRIILLVTIGYLIAFAYDPVKEYLDALPKPTPKPVQTVEPRAPIQTESPRVYVPPKVVKPYIKITYPVPHYAARRGEPLVISWNTNVDNRYFNIWVGGKGYFETDITWIRINTVPSIDGKCTWNIPDNFPYRFVSLFVGLEDSTNRGNWTASDRVFIYVR